MPRHPGKHESVRQIIEEYRYRRRMIAIVLLVLAFALLFFCEISHAPKNRRLGPLDGGPVSRVAKRNTSPVRIGFSGGVPGAPHLASEMWVHSRKARTASEVCGSFSPGIKPAARRHHSAEGRSVARKEKRLPCRAHELPASAITTKSCQAQKLPNSIKTKEI